MSVSVDEARQCFFSLPANLRFPSYHPDYIIADAKRSSDLKPTFFVYTDNKHIYYHAFHMEQVPCTDYVDIQSPYGYGGVLSTTDDKDFLCKAWQKYCEWCNEQNVLVEFVRFHPVIGNQKFYLGKSCYDRQTVWIDLKVEDLLSSYSVRVRTAVRKAIKNELTVKWCQQDEFIRVFPNLYHDTMKSLNAEDFYFFSDEYFIKTINLPKTQLALCIYKDEVVAGAIFLVDEYEMEYHLSAANLTGKKMSATNLIIHEAALLGQKLACKALHLGGGTDSSLDNPLLFFKSGFSACRSNFNIGYYVHKAQIYEHMKKQWLNRKGSISPRILFYRF